MRLLFYLTSLELIPAMSVITAVSQYSVSLFYNDPTLEGDNGRKSNGKAKHKMQKAGRRAINKLSRPGIRCFPHSSALHVMSSGYADRGTSLFHRAPQT